MLVDGEPVLSCLALPVECQGREITTVEGMADGGELHPLQQAFAELGAAQCGYCTPGILLTAEALLADNAGAHPRRDRQALAGNLCRCTGYIKIFEAVELAALRMKRPREGRRGGGPGDRAMSKRFSVIGQSLPKIDAWAKVAGQTLFADDLVLPRMVYGKLLRSRHPHARIMGIDTARARALARRLRGHHRARAAAVKFGILPVSQDEQALCVDKVRFVGDAVAAVAALDEETAERACELIEVEYELLRSLMSIEEALAHPEVRIHDYGDGPNVHKEVSLHFGDVEAAFAEADHVREDVFFFEGNTHLPMEQHAAVAQWGAGRQAHALVVHPDAALRAPPARQGPGHAAGAHPRDRRARRRRLRRQERPVRPRDRGVQALAEDRPAGEDHAHARGGLLRPPRPAPGEDVGQDRLQEGRRHHRHALPLLARRRRLRQLRRGVDLLHRRAADRDVQDPAYKFEGARVFTNKPPCGPKRGHGTPQPRFALECQIDKAAETSASTRRTCGGATWPSRAPSPPTS